MAESKGLLSWDFERSSGSRSRRWTKSRLQLKDDDDDDCDTMPQEITLGIWGGLGGWQLLEDIGGGLYLGRNPPNPPDT